MTAPTRTKIEIGKLPIGTAVLFQFDGPPKALDTKFGPEFQYIGQLDADAKFTPAIFWAKPELHAAIQKAAPAKGQTLEIWKSETTGKGGNERHLHYNAMVLTDEFAPVPRAPSPAESKAPAAETRRASEIAEEREDERLIKADRELKRQDRKAAVKATAAEFGTMPSPYIVALKTAIDAAFAAEQHAETRGMRIQFEAADIRAMAATLYIQAGSQRHAA